MQAIKRTPIDRLWLLDRRAQLRDHSSSKEQKRTSVENKELTTDEVTLLGIHSTIPIAQTKFDIIEAMEHTSLEYTAGLNGHSLDFLPPASKRPSILCLLSSTRPTMLPQFQVLIACLSYSRIFRRCTLHHSPSVTIKVRQRILCHQRQVDLERVPGCSGGCQECQVHRCN